MLKVMPCPSVCPLVWVMSTLWIPTMFDWFLPFRWLSYFFKSWCRLSFRNYFKEMFNFPFTGCIVLPHSPPLKSNFFQKTVKLLIKCESHQMHFSGYFLSYIIMKWIFEVQDCFCGQKKQQQKNLTKISDIVHTNTDISHCSTDNFFMLWCLLQHPNLLFMCKVFGTLDSCLWLTRD